MVEICIMGVTSAQLWRVAAGTRQYIVTRNGCAPELKLYGLVRGVNFGLQCKGSIASSISNNSNDEKAHLKQIIILLFYFLLTPYVKQ